MYFNVASLQATDTDKAVHKAVSITTTILHQYGRSLRVAFNPINKFKLRIVLLTDFNNIKEGKMDCIVQHTTKVFSIIHIEYMRIS